jgi:hypothetical protein
MTSRRRTAHAQRGVVVIALVAVLLLVGTFVIFNSLNLAAVRVDRDRVTNEALAKAKEALIAYAVSDTNRPGELPCPDVNDDGLLVLGEDYGGGGVCTSLIGRLPFRTLDLPDLRDDSGERLWYALSADFRAGNSAVALNNDTAYLAGNTSLRLLTAAGLPAAPDGVVVAVVFSAGAALQRADGVVQARGCTVGVNCDATLKCTTAPASNTPKCNPRNYLDLALGEDNADLLPAANPQFVSAERSSTFNDRAMPIYSDDIMWLVERRAAREYAQHLRDHYDAWQNPPAVANTNFVNFKGFYPWAAPLNDPSAEQPGTNGTTNGSLPLDASSVVWNSGSATLGGCAGVGTTQLTCTAVLVLPLLVTINGRVRNVGTAFVDPPSSANVAVVSGIVLGPPSITWTLVPGSNALDFSYSAVLLGALVTVSATAPTASSWTTTSWLTTNNWYQDAQYAVSSGYALTGAGACALPGPPTCVSVNGNAAYATVVMTGRALPGQATRPVAVLPASATDFLEGVNSTPANLTFVAGLKTSGFNDLPVVVRP